MRWNVNLFDFHTTSHYGIGGYRKEFATSSLKELIAGIAMRRPFGIVAKWL